MVMSHSSVFLNNLFYGASNQYHLSWELSNGSCTSYLLLASRLFPLKFRIIQPSFSILSINGMRTTEVLGSKHTEEQVQCANENSLLQRHEELSLQNSRRCYKSAGSTLVVGNNTWLLRAVYSSTITIFRFCCQALPFAGPLINPKWNK